MNIDFDAARRERQRKLDPLTFTLGGETFECRRVIGLSALFTKPEHVAPEHIVDMATTPVAKSLLTLAINVTAYLKPSEVPKWWALFENPDAEIEATDLINVSEGLVEQYTGRPPLPLDASSNGHRAVTGSGSKSAPAVKDSVTSAKSRRGSRSAGSTPSRARNAKAMTNGRTGTTGSRGATKK